MVEICCADFESVLAAANFGADRVELCSGLGEGGMTPSYGLIRKAVSVPRIKVHVLIRPRPGDFVYTADEVEIMVDDIKTARRLGADGVVIGALNPDGTIDTATVSRLVKAAGPLNITFHRAFDLCRDPEEALETIIGLGCRNLLTSGQAPTAFEGIDMLHRLSSLAGDRLRIIAASGVRASNVEEIVRLARPADVHSSASYKRPSGMEYRNPGVSMGGGADEYVRTTVSPAEVEEITTKYYSIQ